MVEITKGRYGYEAEDGTIQIAESGRRLSLDKCEEERLVKIGCAVLIEEEAKEEPEAEEKSEEDGAPKESDALPEMKLRKRKGRKS